jgi:hypothetical protein
MTAVPRGPRVNAFARTYGPDAPTRIAEYRRVQDYAADNPSAGSAAVASALGLPRSRIRLWVDGEGMPDPVRAVRTASDLGWFAARPGSARFEALLRCHAWLFAGGSIAASTYRPAFSIDADAPEAVLRESLQTLGLAYRYRGEDDEHRCPELVPAKNGALLGRFLVGVLEAPAGSKDDRGPDRVPHWLTQASTGVKLTWARTYLTLRGVRRGDRGGAIQLCEHRNDRYRRSLRDLLRSLVDDPETIRCYGDSSVFVRPDATDTLLSPSRRGPTPTPRTARSNGD